MNFIVSTLDYIGSNIGDKYICLVYQTSIFEFHNLFTCKVREEEVSSDGSIYRINSKSLKIPNSLIKQPT